jgi:hypothetical protein
MAGQVGKVSVENVIFDKTGHLAIGLPCPFMAVRPEGANHLWRKNPSRELSIDLVADERLGRVTGRAGAS